MLIAGCTGVPDLSGSWDVMMDPDYIGNPSVEHCVIQQEHRSLTMVCNGGGPEKALTGEVSRRSVNWGKQMPGKFTASWTGDVDASGTKISGTWQLTLADGFEKHGKFTASRLSR